MEKHQNDNMEKQQLIAVPYEYMAVCNADDDTIDLRELWHVLLKRKKTILATTISVLLAAALYLFLTPSLYDAKGSIKIGHTMAINNGRLTPTYFEDAKRLKHYLDIAYDTAGKYRPEGTTTYIRKVSVPRKLTGFISVTAMGLSNEEAIRELQKPVQEIITRHDAYYESIKSQKNAEITDLRKKIEYNQKTVIPRIKASIDLLKTDQLKKIDRQINDLKEETIPLLEKKIEEAHSEIITREETIDKMRSNLQNLVHKYPAVASITASQISNNQAEIDRLKSTITELQEKINLIKQEQIPGLEVQRLKILKETIPAKEAELAKIKEVTIPGLEAEIKKIETSMKEPYLVRSRVINQFLTHDYPAKPRRKLIVAVALFSGLIAGIMLALFREFLSKQK